MSRSLFGTDGVRGRANAFPMTAEVALKLGEGTFFLKNTAGPVTLTITYLKATGPDGAGGGLSNITEFGGNEIPVPGAIWLMGAGLAGLGFARRKKTA